MNARIMGIDRHRIDTDGKGVSTLVTFHGCPLSCKYCLNPQCKDNNTRTAFITPKELVDKLSVDEIYFVSTGGGVVFGGGEPLLNASYILETVKLMPEMWAKRIETSLNVEWAKMAPLVSQIDQWIVDIKDYSEKIYKEYTGISGERVCGNVKRLYKNIGPEKIRIRIPLIHGFNTQADVEKSVEKYKGLGEIEVFSYKR